MTDTLATSRHLRKLRRRVAARLDLTGHWNEADRIRNFTTQELNTLADLEEAAR